MFPSFVPGRQYAGLVVVVAVVALVAVIGCEIALDLGRKVIRVLVSSKSRVTKSWESYIDRPFVRL